MSPLALDVATPERVRISLPVAGIGYRTLAYLIDASALFGAWVVLYFTLTALQKDVLDSFQALSGLAQTLTVLALFGAQWVYWTACEGLWGGQTLGKRAMRIRVVRQDGSPVGLYESAVRNLTRAVDFLPVLYGTGVLCMLFTEQHRRLGDLLAGTVLVREERIDLDKYARAGATPSPATALAAADVELILGYLERARTLAPEARQKLAQAMVDRFAQDVPNEQRAQLKASVDDAEAFLEQRARAGA
jgi:uncharacterized RDD family membrane protein YckC